MDGESIRDNIVRLGHDEDFIPDPATEPTDTPAGSAARIEVYRLRVEAGQCVWHPDDTSMHAPPRVERPQIVYVPNVYEAPSNSRKRIGDV